jgi:hypothetical protein
MEMLTMEFPLNSLSPPVLNALANKATPYSNYGDTLAQNTKIKGKKVVSSANDETMFQNWIRGTDWFKEFVREYGEEPDLNTKDYDYRAAWKAGVVPERDPYDKNRFHWPSSLSSGKMLKSENHPTAWKEYFMRDTGVNPDALGIKTPEDANTYLKNRR